MPDAFLLPVSIGTLVVALFQWSLKREVSRIDKLFERVEALERTTITKADLDRMETRIIAAGSDRSNTLVERLGQLQGQMNATNQRIDILRDRA